MATPSIQELGERLRSLDGKGYKAYKQVKGRYHAERFDLVIDHVQGDPYAEPSRFRAIVPPHNAGFPDWCRRSPLRRLAAADFLNRVLHVQLSAAAGGPGSGKSGALQILRPGQEVLERASLGLAADGEVEARFRVGLPARGRRILGDAAATLVTLAVVEAVEASLLFEAIAADELREHLEVVEDAARLREQLEPNGLVAFIADGALLPRRSGVDDRPLAPADAVPFQSPETLRVTLDTPNSGRVRGLGVPEGVTLVVGGGYHGKSTVLRAIERGVYNHAPGDGRERVVAVDTAVKVRAEDGRRVAGTDISNFIGGLPGNEDTRRFHTENASGSTSQAAAISEALEVGATCLLLDEDTSATNFMIRDARMQVLIADEMEPITPFIDRARQLHRKLGVSTVVVVGGSGDYFDVADTVIAMHAYAPAEVTAEARRIAETMPTHRIQEGGPWAPLSHRAPRPDSLDPRRGRREVDIKTRSRDRVLFGTHEVDLGAVDQIVELAQTRAMARAIVWARRNAFDGERDLRRSLELVMDTITHHGVGSLHPHGIGELAAFRIFELAAFLNRIRTLETQPLA